MAANLPTYLIPITRDAEVPNADWAGGGNFAGSCAPGVGVNTGNYDPKADDWPRVADTAARNSQSIGGPLKALNAADYAGSDLNDTVAFVQTAGAVADGAVLDITTGAVNRTGQTVPASSWAWGTIPVV